MASDRKWSDEDMLGAIEQEEQTAISWATGELAGVRAEAMRRFNRQPYGTEQEGRSQVVSNDIADAVEGVMPALARIFLSGEEVGRFEPVAPEDQGAETETDVVNHYIMVKNDGFSVLYQSFKDALLLGNGYIKTWWEKQTNIVVERYTGMSDEEATMLMQDKDIEIVEHNEYPDPFAAPVPQPAAAGAGPQPQPMLHDLKVERVRPDEYVAICAVPPDEILVSSRQRETSLASADFVQHRRLISIGELRELGYKIEDDVGDDQHEMHNPEYLARQRFQEQTVDDDSPSDATRRVVTLRETWMRLAMGGEKQTLWRVCVVGKTILHKEEADMIPIACFSPIFYPHSHVGISYASMLDDLAELNTTILRQYLDNLYLNNSNQMVVDINRVNLDDFLVSRPGGIKRVEGNPGEVAMPVPTSDMGSSALQAMEFINQLKETRTGVARVNQGNLDPNALNRTATGASLMMNAGQQRLELIARCLSGGVRDLFLLVHAIAQKHSTKPLQIKLKNKWTQTDPREWVNRTDFTLTVALGTGSPDSQMAKLQMIGPLMQQGAQMGLCGPEEFYNYGKEVLRIAGYRNPDQFLQEPKRDPQTGQAVQPPPQPNPLVQVEQIKQQGKQAELQHTSQMEVQKFQAQIQMDRETMQQKAALDERQTANQMAQEQRAAQMEYELAQQKMQNDMAIKRYEAELQAQTQIRLKEMELEHQRSQGTLQRYQQQPMTQ